MDTKYTQNWQPTPIYPVWFRPDEVQEVFAIHERTGELATIVRKIKAAQATKGIH